MLRLEPDRDLDGFLWNVEAQGQSGLRLGDGQRLRALGFRQPWPTPAAESQDARFGSGWLSCSGRGRYTSHLWATVVRLGRPIAGTQHLRTWFTHARDDRLLTPLMTMTALVFPA